MTMGLRLRRSRGSYRRVSRWVALVVPGVLFAAGCVIDLGTLGGRFAAATDINERGVTVGWSTVSGDDERRHAFRSSPGRPLVDLNGSFLQSEALAVNDAGIVVGRAEVAEGDFRAMLWDRRGRPHDLGAGSDSTAVDINDHGTIVGTASQVGGGFVRDWATGEMESLRGLPPSNGIPSGAAPEAINDEGTIVGIAWIYPHAHGVLWTAGAHEPVVLPQPQTSRPSGGRMHSQARDINNEGTIVGSTSTHGLAVLWRAGTHEAVDITPADGFGAASGINDRGQVVGTVDDIGAVRWDRPTARPVDLDGHVGPSNHASKINDAGFAAGSTTTSEGPPSDESTGSHAVIYPPRHGARATEVSAG
jgi:probable HAF family extracellular repeat protein